MSGDKRRAHPNQPVEPERMMPTLHVDRFIDVPQVPRWAGYVVYVLVALIVAFAIWAVLAKYDVVVKGEGRLTAPTEQISTQVYETAVVRSIDVRIGEQVKKGARLATLDPTFTTADRDDLIHQVQVLTATRQRIEAEIDGRPYGSPNPNPSEMAELRIYRERQAERQSHLGSLDGKITSLEPQLEFEKNNEPLMKEQLRLSRDLVSMNQELADAGWGYKKQLLEAKGKEVDALSKIIEVQRDQLKLTEEITTAQSDRDSYENEWFRKLAEDYQTNSKDLETAASKLAKANRRSELVAMTAPVDATVLDIPKRNIGSVLREGETLMTLIPNTTSMPADVAIESKDIAYLQLGQAATIKFEALPYQEHGAVYGKLIALTPDTTSDNAMSEESGQSNSNRQNSNGKRYYRALISIDRQELKMLPDGFELRPGMRVSADIKVGRRTVAAYLLHPLMRAFDESFREK